MAFVVLMGCTAAPTPQPQVDAHQVLRQSVERLLALESSAFALDHQEGTTVLLPGIEMTKVYGFVEIPDRFQFTVEAQVSNLFVKASVVVIGDEAYMTDFLTGQWREVSPEVLPFNFSNLGQTLADLIESVQAPRLVAVETLNDRLAYRIRGTGSSNDLSQLVPNAGSGFDVELELWIDQTEGLLRKVLISGRVVDTDVPESVRVLTLDDIDLPVQITAPK